MKKHLCFLQIEHFTKSVFETDIMDSNVKVIIPSGIPEKFMVLNTEKTKFEKTSPEKDIKKLEKTYKDFDFFYLCISEEIKSYTEFVLYSSDDTYVDDVVAFIGVPKNNDWYIKSKQDYLDGIQVALENYYNQINEWNILVMNEQCDEHPEEYYSYVVDDFLLRYDDGKFDPESEEWFKICKTKYGITQQEIDEAKNIIKSYKWSDKSVYKIQSKTIFNNKGVNTMTEKMFTKSWFLNLDKTLRDNGLDSDLYSFDEILKRIKDDNFKVSPDEFASCAAYSILASGFRQKTAKQCHQKIMDKLSQKHTRNDLLQIFNRDTKINAIMEIWNNRDKYCADYYKCETLEDKLNFLKKLPNLGNITKDHLARNLGENVVKYDIWVQRLGIIYSGNPNLRENNANLQPEIKQACDDMFNHLIKETGLPRGYIDAVLFKAASNGLIEIVSEKKKAKK